MKTDIMIMHSGYDGKRCITNVRSSKLPDGSFYAFGQYLDVTGVDYFDGILMSKLENGKWTEFKPVKALAGIKDSEGVTVPVESNLLYHKKTGKALLIGGTCHYKYGEKEPDSNRNTFYTVMEGDNFGEIKYISMPKEYMYCGYGGGTVYEAENGDLFIPIYYKTSPESLYYACVIRCSFDGSTAKLLEIGKPMTVNCQRGFAEPSIIKFNGKFYITLRNDEFGYVGESDNGLDYYNIKKWCWDDGSILPTYNTQQHWFELSGKLYLVYTRRGAGNDHVFRHRAPLFAAEVRNMRVVKDTEFIAVPERGARLGNFGTFSDGDKAYVTAAEWMQPIGCEKYGCDNSVYFVTVEKETK